MARDEIEPRITIGNATMFILAVNMALDTGKYDHLTQEEVKEHIQSGDLVPWLEVRFASSSGGCRRLRRCMNPL